MSNVIGYSLAPRPSRGAVWARRAVVLLVFLGLALLFYQVYGPQLGGPHDNIPWLTSLDAGLRQAKQTGKPVLVDFSASWCPPCQEMKRSAWPDSKVETLVRSNFVPVLMDADSPQAEGPAQRYGVETIPAIFILDADGNVLRHAQFMSKDDLISFLSSGGHAG